jgi:chromosome segregation ATPase
VYFNEMLHIKTVSYIILHIVQNTIHNTDGKIMARKGITYDEVALAADRLVSEGINPTIARVREELGTGSPNTVHRHLSNWKERQPQAQREAATLPLGLADALVKEIERQAAAARANAEEKALDARQSADNLAEVGEALEEDNESLKEAAEQFKRERDQSQTLADDREHEIVRLVSACDREQQAAESARVELAKAQLTIESYVERIVEQKESIKHLTEKLDAERVLKQDAEQRAAVSESKVTILFDENQTLKSALKEIESQLRDAERVHADVAVSEHKATFLTEKFAELEARFTKAEEERYNARLLADRNQEKLIVANEKFADMEAKFKAAQEL